MSEDVPAVLTNETEEDLNAAAARYTIPTITQDVELQTEIDLVCLLADYPELSEQVRECIAPEQISDNKVGALIQNFLYNNVSLTWSVLQDNLSPITYELRHIQKVDAQKTIDAVVCNWKMRYSQKKLPQQLFKATSVTDIELILGKATQLMSEGNLDTKSVDRGGYRKDFWKNFSAPDKGWSTGLKNIDTHMYGRMQPGEVMVISADTGVGKTQLTNKIALYVAEVEKTPVAMFEFEMARNQQLGRFIAMNTSVESRCIREKKLTAQQIKTVDEWLNHFESSVPLYIIDSIFDFGAVCKQIRFLYKKGVRVVVLDYLQLMMKDPTSVKEIEMITASLKRLARSIGVSIILVAQFSRKADDVKVFKDGIVRREPRLSDLKGGSAIEQNADAILFLYIDQRLEHETMLNTKHIEAIMAKNRNGMQFRTWLEMDSSHCLFRDAVDYVPPWIAMENMKQK